MEFCVRFWTLHDKKDIEMLEVQQKKDKKDIEVQRKAVELGKGLEHEFYDKLLREQGVFSLDKRRFRGDFVTLQLPERRL